MPCRNDYEDCGDSSNDIELGIVAPALCAIFYKLEKEYGLLMEGFLNQIDWTEAGVTKKDVLDWWKGHKKQDEIRRAREEAARVLQKKRDAALAKLTPEERKLLKLK